MNENADVDVLTGAIDPSQLKNFFKYCSDDKKVIKGLFTDHKIRFTQPAALNDPLEFNPIIRFKQSEGKYTNYIFDGIIFPSEEIRVRHQLIERQFNEFGILSLTKVPDSFNMWSRYANGHRGFLIEFKSDFYKNPCMLSKDGTEYKVRKVEYVDEYAVNIDELVDEHGLIPFSVFNEHMFFTKTSRWKDEIEYRMVRKLSDDPGWKQLANKAHRDRNVYLFDFSLECIVSVTFGACTSVENKKIIIKACEGTGTKFLQIVIIRDQMDRWNQPAKMMLRKVEDGHDLLRRGDLGMFFEQRYFGEVRKPAVPVKRLSEIPYYVGNEEWIGKLYESEKSKQEK